MTPSTDKNNKLTVVPPEKKLIEDIKPQPTKNRTQIGVVHLTLDEKTAVKAVGQVYGLEHQISDEGFNASIFLDHYNQRIKVLNYDGNDISSFTKRLNWLAQANGFDKIFCMATRADWQKYLKHGYVLEALIKYYHQGEDAFLMSKFLSQDRITSHCLMEEISLIENLLETEVTPPGDKKLAEGYTLRLAQRTDIESLVNLYQTIFETYPSPLIHEDYLRTVFQKETLFAVIVNNEKKIVSAASAELNPKSLSAELTDCATLKSERGKGLMSVILIFLENELREKKYLCAYTIARARSYGMNNTFYHLQYEFMGRLINNCDIYGAYEDMNIWVKKLSTDTDAKI